ncbi:MAG: 3-hydroxyacyl-CoA dehydrogenase NAD-binding domain-containing protein [Dermatophilaceae bacterium]
MVAMNAVPPVAVIGAGAMGSGIAQVAVSAGRPVYLVTPRRGSRSARATASGRPC